ncbi:MAG: nucleoside recognition protein [Desulfobacterales bacterium]
MARRKSGIPYRALGISLAVSALLLTAGLLTIEHLTLTHATRRLLGPLTRLLGFIGAGLVAGQLIEAAGWTRYLAVLAGPLFRFGRLGPHCSATFATAFLSGVAANAMLLEFFKEGRITRRQLFLTNFVNQLPAYFLHLPTTFFIVIPLTGRAGALYFLLTFLAALLRTLFFLVYGRFSAPEPAQEKAAPAGNDHRPPPGGRQERIWQGLRRKFPARLTQVAVYVVPIYIAVFLVNTVGLFDQTRNWLARYVVTTFIPVEALSVVILSFAAEFTSGFAAAGALMEAGMLTTRQTVLALLIGNLVAFPIRALRHQLPHYMGIFAPAMGAELLLMGQGFRVLSLAAVGVVYFLVT